MAHYRITRTIIAATLFLPSVILAQLEPDTAQVNLYFPQLADGGDQAQTWQTSFVFTNSNPAMPVACMLSTLNDSGGPLALDLGTGLQSRQSFTIPPLGRKTLRSLMASRSVVTGWAYAACSLPVQGTVLFRQIVNGVPQVEISAPASLPSPIYRSAANRSLGVALVNVYNRPVTITLQAFDSAGNQVGSRDITLCALCHTSFNLSSFSGNFPRDFEGMAVLSGSEPSTVFSAWTLNAERGLLSSLPSGGVSWPGGHEDKIWRAYDPYASAGAMGKLMMITNRTDLFSQAFDNLRDPHTSFSNRMGVLFATLQLACSLPAGQSACAQYRNAIHP
ncbi:MAG: hypothetical protein LC126_21715, partial [Bryobacterales bacterium]|nr:hypothetical protein [Bryobacterales bacterium]